MNDKIDVVILWVNGNDENWLNKKKYWEKKHNIYMDNSERYRSWDNLKFIFRGVEKYMPWTNKIYLVSDNQKPKWLDTSNNKIEVINHTEIISSEFLPVFNSRAIELNIHKIKGLSENFIYFNDDAFILKDCMKTDFFKNDIPVDAGIMDVIYPKKINSIQKVMLNNLGVINSNFDKRKMFLKKPFNWINFKYGKSLVNNVLLFKWKPFTNFANHHLPLALKKTTFNEVWEKYREELKKTTASKFRLDNNYNVWLMRYWQLASNNFYPRSKNIGQTVQITDRESAIYAAEIIKNKKNKLICINDNEKTQDFKQAKKIVNKALEDNLWQKSTFEL